MLQTLFRRMACGLSALTFSAAAAVADPDPGTITATVTFDAGVLFTSSLNALAAAANSPGLGISTFTFTQETTDGVFGNTDQVGDDYCGVLSVSDTRNGTVTYDVCVGAVTPTPPAASLILGFYADPDSSITTTSYAYAGSNTALGTEGGRGGYQGSSIYAVSATTAFMLIPNGKTVTFADGGNSTVVRNAANGLTALNTYRIAQLPAEILTPATATISTATVTADFTASESGTDTGTLLFALSKPPSARVTVTIGNDSGTECAFSPSSLSFTSLNWSTAQAVTVTATDDNAQEGSHACIPAYTAISDDTDYDGLTNTLDPVTITDNDAPGFDLPATATIGAQTITATSAATEGGDDAVILLALTTAPTADVTADFRLVSGSECTISPEQMTFTALNWNAAQAITITAVDDGNTEGDHACTVEATFTSPDANYQALGSPTLATIAVTDNPFGGFTFPASIPGGASGDPLSADLTATEDGRSGDLLIALNKAPTANVTVTIADQTGSQCTYDDATLTFTPSNWDVVQDLNVEAIDDAVAEGDHACTPLVTAASDDASFDGVTATMDPVTITDNDTAGIASPASAVIGTQTVTATTTATEGGDAATALLALTSEPTADVTLTLASVTGTDCTYAPGPLTFTPANWDQPQAVTITATDDDTAQGSRACTPAVTIASADPGYAAFTQAQPLAPVTITDNDTAGFDTPSRATINRAEVIATATAAEDGTTATFLFALTSAPVASVTVTFAAGDQGPCTFAPETITFDATDWDSVRAITVTATDDDVAEGEHACTPIASFASADTAYQLADATLATVTITDNDEAGIQGHPTAVIDDQLVTLTLAATEGGASALLPLSLRTLPSAAVTLTFADSADGQCTVMPATLVFAPQDWSAPQLLTITATDDAFAEGAHACIVTVAITSDDPNYDGGAEDSPSIAITDNDTAGHVAPSSGTVGPGPLSADLTASEDRADFANFLFGITSQPRADVTVTFADQTGTQCEYGPASFTFTSTNWNQLTSINVAALADTVTEGDHACTPVATFTSTDPDYDLAPVTLSAITLTDDDSAGADLPARAVIGAATLDAINAATEGGDTGLLLIGLTSQPTAQVTLTLSDSTGQCDFQPATLDFAANAPADAQAVTVTARDDARAEGDHACTPGLAFQSGDPFYDLPAITLQAITLSDNDVAAVTSPASAVIGAATVLADTTASEAGDTATALLVLASQPAADVVLTFRDDTGAQCSVSPAPMTFTPGNWDRAQALTITAIDDSLPETAQTCLATFSAASDDPGYDGLSDDLPFAVTITDNDIPGHVAPPTAVIADQTVTATSAAQEGGADGVILLALATTPAAEVTVTFSNASGAECSFAPAALVFAPASWSQAQAITVTATDDPRVESAHACTPVAAFSSADPDYQLPDVTLSAVSITDNDTASVATPQQALVSDTLVAADTTASEDGDTATALFVLTAQPAAEVTISLASQTGADCTYVPGSVTFGPATWDQPQAVTISAVDDDIAQGDHACQPVATVTSDDPVHDRLPVTLAPVTITDNDTAGHVTPGQAVIGGDAVSADLQAGEDGDPATLLFALTSQPASDVTVTFADQTGTLCGYAPAQVTFTPASWADPRAITVTGADDDTVDGTQTCIPTASFASADASYQQTGIALAPVLVSDDDTADVAQPATASIGGQTVTASSATTEGGPPATILVALTAQPSQDVTLTFSSGGPPQRRSLPPPPEDPAADQCAFAPSPVTFTAADWNQPQAVQVTALDDTDAEGAHACFPVVTFASGDPVFDLGARTLAPVTITDNDNVGVAITGQDLAATEGASATASMSLALTAPPTAPVTLTVTGDDQCTVSPAIITLTPDTWAQTQALAITARDDTRAEGPHACQPAVTVTSADLRYDGIAVALPAIAITEDPLDQVRDPLTALLQDDLAQTAARQSQAFRSIAQDRLAAGTAGQPCGPASQPGLDATATPDALTADATFAAADLDCATGQRRLTWGDLTITDTGDLGRQSMLTYGYARETATDDRIRGWFWGGYATQSDVTGQGATGDITGLGLNGGIYGARRLHDGLFADYYAAAAAGRHRFDLTFTDGILATGDYQWAGLFAGAALSGRHDLGLSVVAPRAGFDLGLAAASDPSVTVTHQDIDQTGTLALDPVTGLRLYAEAGFAFDSNPAPGATLTQEYTLTPRLICETGFGTDDMTCGYGLGLSFAHADRRAGTAWTLALDYESRDDTTRTTLKISRERTILRGAGTVTSGVGVTSDGAPMLSHAVALQW